MAVGDGDFHAELDSYIILFDFRNIDVNNGVHNFLSKIPFFAHQF